ncbi:MAG: right-handed parallel beta-helix repeat-containing protein [bacterium]|nr:right-handed parallel beta-helix repeat-containing protein [bacterium]
MNKRKDPGSRRFKLWGDSDICSTTRIYPKRYSIFTFLLVSLLCLPVTSRAMNYTVTNLNDSGAGSFRWAIQQANNAGADTILFDSSLQGGTISINSVLPDLTDNSTTIDASNIWDTVNNTPGITLDATGGGNNEGLVFSGNYCAMYGVRIVNTGDDGITINGNHNTIGGTGPGQTNVFVNTDHTGGEGIEVAGGDFNTITGNYIGLETSGAPNGNYCGGIVLEDAQDNLISTNMIAYNSVVGIKIRGSSADRNRITQNSIYSNGNTGSECGCGSSCQLGIDILEAGWCDCGTNANDGGFNTGVANDEIDHPVIASASLSGNILSVEGYIGAGSGSANFAGATVEFFIADVQAAGYGEGETYLGSCTADANGKFDCDIDVSGKGVTSSDWITATSWLSTHGSSEFGGNVTVGSDPAADAGSDQTICSGGSAGIGGAPTASGGTSPYTYSWSPAAGLSSSTVANPTASPGSTTTYTVTVTDNNGLQATDSVVVTVNPNPTANAGSDQTICSGGSVVIGGSPTASGGTPPYTYSWSPATGLSSSTAANPTASPGATITYTATVTDANGCQATDTVVVTVNPNPIADAGPNQPTTPVVIGGSPTASGGTLPYTYSWSPTTGLSSSTVANPTASPGVATTYTVTVTDANGCQAADDVLVGPPPLTPTADAGSDQTICSGGSAGIGGAPTASGGTSSYTYSWSPAAGLSSSTVANPTASPGSTTTYTVTVTDNNGLQASDSVVVTVNPNPTANAGSDQTICSGGSVVIGGSPTASGGTPPYTYSWSPATGLSSSTAANPTASPGATITYTATVTDANGCQATDSVVVTVNPNPTASAGLDQTIAFGNSVVIGGSPTASGGTPPYTYSWSPTIGLNDPTLANPTASPSDTTIYTVTVTDANGCQDVDIVFITVTSHPVPTMTGWGIIAATVIMALVMLLALRRKRGLQV